VLVVGQPDKQRFSLSRGTFRADLPMDLWVSISDTQT
jgi:hypothetical protein